MSPPEYAELICQSASSPGGGASLPEELVLRAHAIGLRAMGLCDRDSIRGLPRAERAARELGFTVLHGVALTLTGLPELVLYAEDPGGWARICALLTRPGGDPLERSGGLLALASGDWAAHPEAAGAIAEAFGDRLYITASRLLRADDAPRCAAAEGLARRLGRPVVATCRVLLHRRSRKRVQDVLTCSAHGVRLDEAGRLLEPNAERCLRAPRELAALFRDRPGWVRRSLEIAERCGAWLAGGPPHYPAALVAESARRMPARRALEIASTALGLDTPERSGDAARRALARELAEELRALPPGISPPSRS